ncbi:hypothetical protein CC85DRAFT_326667 [Cutaneotrichosporon oleaginosum]|uniref:Uncharacterized protein n=1 Tax=Cutaneotrichosporon oleaginosum TaxID=879819 RepID=A0A0J0XT45_9TREE|nr:uncharacterized protein CC85DRAFT_326667 [Cutaneotrichosporon oleaginosum]KLT44247.1 hypothetical protein CC85DRAFT_326667 [Cutaneotrichosporon oleaginosum]TXT11585.1 hypothetical protein COLE_01995 [Cutaneotrichosporon oleaginosum]
MTPTTTRRSLGGETKPDPYEVLYNTAVQAFVRRDHAKTQASLEKLLALTRKLPRDSAAWHDLAAAAPNGETAAAEEWVTKTLKLAISANASLYSDPPKAFQAMPHLLPPAPPTMMLEYIRDLCTKTYGQALLPPQLVSTVLLAALKLRPAEPALAFAHQLAEDWLTALPDKFVLAIAQPHQGGNSAAASAARKRTDAAREGYLKVVELFVGEVLGREGEWEMARGLLEGEMVMGSKKKEVLYRHLRQLEQQRSVPPSPSSSGFLPSPASDTTTGDGKRRSRALSAASTSSSEATARPAGGVAGPSTRQVKGKERAHAHESEGGDSTILPPKSEATAVPTKVYVHHPPRAPTPTPPTDERALWLRTTMRLLPPTLALRLEALAASGWLVPALLPIPAAIVIALFAIQRRRRRATGHEVMGVRERLRQVRMHGLRPWLAYWFRWWVEKLKGVWNLGTTITYM